MAYTQILYQIVFSTKNREKVLSIFISVLLVSAYGQNLSSKDYTKKEVYITMRDGIKLFTAIYSPKNTTKDYPILVTRTTYSCRPYGEDTIPKNIMYNPDLVAKGYIFVFQDVRGRWMSEGVFENIKPPYSLWDKTKTDELTDAWDTFEWLTKKVKHFNGNIGVYGNSYLGWSTLTAAASNHPAVKAVIAMAPVTNFFFEDFTRYGLVAINYAPIMNAFGIEKDYPTKEAWYSLSKDFIADSQKNLTYDYYQYFLDLFTLKSIRRSLIDSNNVFFNNLAIHTNYDSFRKKRNWLNYIKNIHIQVMIAGGWNDEQNLYGILNSFKTIDKYSPKANVKLVMGPWAHSHPKERKEKYYLGDIFYGYNLAEDYQKNVQVPYFEYYLKGIGTEPGFKTRIFDTGLKTWVETSTNPLYTEKTITYYLNNDGRLAKTSSKPDSYAEYISDPFHPIPFIQSDDFYHIAPKYYMTTDQRPASKRPDVLTYVSDKLDKNTTILGQPQALISFETDHTAADIYVKIIDVYPMERTPEKEDKPGVKMNGYQQLVRIGYIRGRFRDSFSTPKPFTPGEKYDINVPLLEINHTFKKGHRIMIQIQSSDFPLFDINPQNYIDNVFNADRKDFSNAIHKVYSTSKIILPVVQE